MFGMGTGGTFSLWPPETLSAGGRRARRALPSRAEKGEEIINDRSVGVQSTVTETRGVCSKALCAVIVRWVLFHPLSPSHPDARSREGKRSTVK